MPPTLTFLTPLRPNRPDFLATRTPEEKTVMGQHMAYTRLLFDQGKIVLGGAATSGAIGIIVWRVDSAEEMQRILKTAAGQGPSGLAGPGPLGGGGAPGDGMRMIRPRLIIISQPRPGSDSRPSAGRVGSVENPK